MSQKKREEIEKEMGDKRGKIVKKALYQDNNRINVQIQSDDLIRLGVIFKRYIFNSVQIYRRESNQQKLIEEW